MKFRITLILFLLARVSLFHNAFLHNAFAQDASDRYVIPALSPPVSAETVPEIPAVSMFWEGAPAQMAAGERTVFTLRSAKRAVNTLDSIPGAAAFFMPEVPPGAILAQLPVSAEEKNGGVVIKFNLIPLEGDFILPARVLQYEDERFEIPALHISVNGLAEELPQRSSYDASRPALAQDAFVSDNSAAPEKPPENNSQLKLKILIGLSFFFIQLIIISLIVCFVLIGKKRELRRHSG